MSGMLDNINGVICVGSILILLRLLSFWNDSHVLVSIITGRLLGVNLKLENQKRNLFIQID